MCAASFAALDSKQRVQLCDALPDLINARGKAKELGRIEVHCDESMRQNPQKLFVSLPKIIAGEDLTKVCSMNFNHLEALSQDDNQLTCADVASRIAAYLGMIEKGFLLLRPARKSQSFGLLVMIWDEEKVGLASFQVKGFLLRI